MANKAKKDVKTYTQPTKKKFLSTLPILLCHNDNLLIEGSIEAYIPPVMQRIEINKMRNKLASDDMKMASYFYELAESHLAGADLKIYQLPEDYSGEIEDYTDQKVPLELIKHITNYDEIGFYEFGPHLYNEFLSTLGGGIQLGKQRKKS